METITTTVRLPVLQGWACPSCGGRGNLGDGMFSIGVDTKTGETVMSSRAPTRCIICNGKGRVHVTPLED